MGNLEKRMERLEQRRTEQDKEERPYLLTTSEQLERGEGPRVPTKTYVDFKGPDEWDEEQP